MTPRRLIPLLRQFDFARQRLTDRMTGPTVDSGNGSPVEVSPMTDEEHLWEPVPGCWSVRRRSQGPGPRASLLVGTGDWGRDGAPMPHPSPPPFTTIAWRLSHLTELLALRADHTAGNHTMTQDDHRASGVAAEAIRAFDASAAQWRKALLTADDNALDTFGYSTYPYGSDPDVPFIEIVWWTNQELLHHGAEIALMRDLYRAGHQ
ncbi:DinB family protein [Streptoalloteichus hindustanus]|uniref:DinB superfamily protein n=1 Tax=Streptoalloteichus hindustanus TaxID=2017 RepID=A0A1M5FS59_STRHI|nr:DinB family protein [Streptoalloteichus hindustanus]SHF94355.1 DinB superfamily protein [Streptoalloteichus hindustanus]